MIVMQESVINQEAATPISQEKKRKNFHWLGRIRRYPIKSNK